MKTVLENLNRGFLIEAIKCFRSEYGVGLKEAKDAVEAIRDALPKPCVEAKGKYLVLSRQDEWSSDYDLSECDDKDEAVAEAASIVGNRKHTIVARIISQSVTVTTRVMKDAA